MSGQEETSSQMPPPVELLQEVARGVGLCNWVRWEAGDCKVGAGGGDSQERGMEGRSVQKGGGGVWGICRWGGRQEF